MNFSPNRKTIRSSGEIEISIKCENSPKEQFEEEF